jgi:uncharacterized protein YndB with AHSA1/START domain
MCAQRDVVVAQVSRIFPYPAERVFDAWLDPERAGQWLFATPDGEMVRAETDPRVGGRFVFTDRRDGEDVEHSGEYLEIDRPRRLRFTFAVSGVDGPPDVVSITIVPHPEGCELTLTHEMGAEYGEYLDSASKAWSGMLEDLARQLETAS